MSTVNNLESQIPSQVIHIQSDNHYRVFLLIIGVTTKFPLRFLKFNIMVKVELALPSEHMLTQIQHMN